MFPSDNGPSGQSGPSSLIYNSDRPSRQPIRLLGLPCPSSNERPLSPSDDDGDKMTTTATRDVTGVVRKREENDIRSAINGKILALVLL